MNKVACGPSDFPAMHECVSRPSWGEARLAPSRAGIRAPGHERHPMLSMRFMSNAFLAPALTMRQRVERRQDEEREQG